MAERETKLQLTLTADGRGLTGTLRTATGELRSFSTAANEVEKSSAGAGAGVFKLGTIMGLAAAAGSKIIDVVGEVIVAFPKLVAQQVNYAASVGDVAQRTGVAAETISGMASRARLAGGDLGDVTGLLDAFNRTAVRAAGGSRQQAAAFSAMGISVLDAGGKLKSTDALLAEATRKLAGYADGSAKTALAQQLFGDRAKELMPVLDALGREGIQGVIDQARAMGQVVDGDMASAAQQVQAQLRQLREQLGGYAASVASDVLPVVIALAGEWVHNDSAAQGASRSFDRAGTSTTGVGQAIKDVIAWFVAMYGAVQQVGVYLGDFFARVRTDWDETKRTLADPAWWSGFAQLTAGALSGNVSLLLRGRAQLQAVNRDIDREFAARRAGNEAALRESLAYIDASTSRTLGKLLTTARDTASGINAATKPLGDDDAPIVKFGKHVDGSTKALEQLNKMFAQDAQEVARLRGGLDPVAKLYQDLVQRVAAANAQYQAEVALITKAKLGLDALATAKRNLVERTSAAISVTEKEIAAYEKQNDVVGTLLDKIERETATLGLTERQRAMEDAVTQARVAWEKLTEAERAHEVQAGKLSPVTEEGERAIRHAIAAQYDFRDVLAQQRNELQQTIDRWGRFADAIGSAMTRGGNLLRNLGRAMVDTLRDIVTQLVQQWLRTRIIGTFVGGAGGGLGGVAMSAAGQMLGGGSSFSGGAGGGSGFNFGAGDLFSPSSWASAGRSLWNGFVGGANAASSSTILGSWSGTQFGGVAYAPFAGGSELGLVPNYAGGAPGSVGVSSMPGTYSPSPLGYGLAAAGGIAAGVSRWNNSGKDLGGGLGAAAYGVGTYSAAIGASAALSGGLAAGMAAIPVVGWIALAAMLVDMISGGKLFGTKFRPESVTQSIGVSADGAIAGFGTRDVRQSAFFGGREWRDKALDVPPELLAAAERFFNAIGKVMTDGARKLAIDTPPMLDAAIRTVSEVDKKGKVTATKYFVDVLGHTWEEASSELASTRVAAEAIVATVAASEAGQQASRIAEQWRYSAETLMDGAQLLLAATADIAHGRGLLSHGTGIAGTATLPDLPGGGSGGVGGGLGKDPLLPVALKAIAAGAADAVHQVSDELARTVEVVQELAGADESLTDAYARLVADANNLQQALDLTGVQLDITSEDFVRFAAGIEAAAGGLQQANALWQGYFSAYYSQSELSINQLLALQASATSQLESLGLDATTSMRGFRDAFTAALPTLGADEVVQWLQAGNALAQMTSANAQLAEQVAQVLGPMGLLTGGLSQFGQAIAAIKAQEASAIEAANAIARAQGREGASALQLAAIHQWTASQIAAAIRQLQAETRDLIARLYGGVPGTLDGINARIGELEQSLGGVSSGIDAVTASGSDLFEQWQRGIQSLSDYLNQSLFGDLSPLSDEEQIAEARRQLDDAIAAARDGNVDALAQLPQLMQQFAQLWRGGVASGDDFNSVILAYRDQLKGLLGIAGPAAPSNGVPGTVQLVPSDELRALYAARDAMLAEQEDAYRAQLAGQLAQHLADLATLYGVNVLALVDAEGVALDALARDLGVNLDRLDADSVQALGNLATTLGVTMTDLTGRVGVSLTDLASGLTELTGRVGIDLSALTAQSTQSLAALAGSLGMDLSEFAASVGINLGALSDSQSLLNQALAAEIAGLPADQRDALAPLLSAIADATSDADANAAIGALESAVNALSPAIRNELAPYLQGVFPARALTQLDYLGDLQAIAQRQLGTLDDIRRNLSASNAAAGIPAYAAGGWVNGPTTLLAGEAGRELILPNPVSEWFARVGIPINAGGAGGDSPAQLAEMRALRAEIVELRRAQAELLRAVNDTIERTGDRSDERRVQALTEQADRMNRDRSTRHG